MWHRIPIIVVHNKQISLLYYKEYIGLPNLKSGCGSIKKEWVGQQHYLFQQKAYKNTSILLRNNNGIDEVINKRGVGGDRAGAMY